MEDTFEILDESVRHQLENEVLILELAVPGHEHLPPCVSAEGGHKAALECGPDLVRHIKHSRLPTVREGVRGILSGRNMSTVYLYCKDKGHPLVISCLRIVFICQIFILFLLDYTFQVVLKIQIYEFSLAFDFNYTWYSGGI